MIDRRFFMKLFVTTPFVVGSTKIVAEKPKLTSKVLLNKCSVAGFQYYQGSKHIHQLKEKDVLSLIPEPTNNYDPYAVQIFYQQQKLGYIPKTDNKPISRMLHANVPLTCQVLDTDPNKLAWHAVIVAVYLQV